MDFSIPAAWQSVRDRVVDFIASHVEPLEKEAAADGAIAPEALCRVRQLARSAGLWAPQLPQEWGGLGLDLPALCPVFEAAGRSPLGPLALHCAAPDEGNMHLLLLAATAEQKERYLKPLAAAEIHSCFAMTEPHPGAGADPTMMRTRAERRGDAWVINGRKWFVTGAQGAAFAIVAAVTDPDAPKKQAMSLFLVDQGTPGYEVVRPVPTMTSHGLGGHCEICLTDCTVSENQVLGGIGQGFALMQARLGPARLTHCMRWIGAASRAIEIATDYARRRQAFGKHLAEHQAVQWMLADSAIDLHASRLMVHEAAWQLEQGNQARTETSMCKVFVAEAVGRVIDRAIQICGASGVSRDLVLEWFYRDARAFRIYDGPSEVHRMVIARRMLRPPA